jgi:Rieske Fe-S protein
MAYRSSERLVKGISERPGSEASSEGCSADSGLRRVFEATDDASNGNDMAKGFSKAEAKSGVRRLQRFFGLAFLLSALCGVYLLATDKSLWLLALSHAVGLVVIVVIDVALGILNLRLRRKIYLPSVAAALLGFLLQLGDILTAPQYNMTMRYFASYLFGLWAFDLLLVLQFAVIAFGVAARGYQRELARRQKTKRARELGYSRRGFLRAIASFAAVIAVVVTLGSVKLPPPNTPPSQSSQATQSGQSTRGSQSARTSSVKPNGAIANTNDLQVGSPVYFEYPKGYPSMLLKKANGALVALSMLCTHVCCECTYEPSSSVIFCPCHGSVFDSTGSVLRGPAGTPLPSVELTIDTSGFIYPKGINGYGPCVH